MDRASDHKARRGADLGAIFVALRMTPLCPHTINGVAVTAAERDYQFGAHSGNNYVVEVSTEPDFSTILGQSSIFVAWRRTYIEYDRMFMSGGAITTAFTPDADTADDVLTVSDASDASVGEQVTLFTPTDSVNRTVIAKTASSLTVADVGLALPKYSGFRPTTATATHSVSFDGLTPAFGDNADSRTADGGAFVEFIRGIDGSGGIPKFQGSQTETHELVRHWFQHYADRHKVVLVSALGDPGYTVVVPAETGGTIEVAPAGHIIDDIGKDRIAVVYRLHNQRTLAHEMGHLFGLIGQSWVDSYEPKPDHRNLSVSNFSHIDIMSYKSTGEEFSVDSLEIIRRHRAIDSLPPF